MQGSAKYTSLRVKTARTDNQLLYMQVIRDVPSLLTVQSPIFMTTPGALKSLNFLRDPGLLSPETGCRRCPHGVHVAGETLPVEVELLDAFHNRITFCFSGQSCEYLPDATVAAQLISSASDEQEGTLAGQLTDEGEAGSLAFTDLSVELAGPEYVLRLCMVDELANPVIAAKRRQSYGLEQRLCAAGGNHLQVQVDSKPFAVVPSRPAALKILAMSVNSGEFEKLPVQPEIEIVDTFGNTVDRDCYRAECAALNHTCNSTGLSACPVHIDVSLAGASNVSRVQGTTMVSDLHGVAKFTDISILADSSEWPGPFVKCVCPMGVCKLCSASDCTHPAPFPYYSLQFQADPTADGYALATLDTDITLHRRAQSMKIIVQPALIVAREVFASDIVIEVLDCARSVAIFDTSYVLAAMDDNAGGGTLSGKTTVQLRNGLAIFSNLGIDLFGNGYTLKFSYAGTAAVSNVKSRPFRVERPVEILEQVQISSFRGRVTAGVSFDVEAVQPVVELRGLDGKKLANTVLPVTASISALMDPGSWQNW